MARPKKAAKKVGGLRKSAGRKSVEVHFSALDAKLELYRSELEQMFNVFHGEVVKVDSTLTQIGQLLFGQRVPVAHQASPQVAAPALQVVQPQPAPQPAQQVETPYHVRFIPPVRAQQVDAHGNPLPQS